MDSMLFEMIEQGEFYPDNEIPDEDEMAEELDLFELFKQAVTRGEKGQ